MHDSTRMGCERCGLHRICFPGSMARAAQHAAQPLHIRRVRIARDNALYRSGDRVDSFYMIRSGCVKEIDESINRCGAVTNFALPGEMLSLQSAGSPISETTSIALEPSFVCVVPWAAFNQLCVDLPKIALEFIRLIAKAGSDARELLTLIRDKEAHQRVSGFLLNISQRIQIRGVRQGEFRLGMNRHDIGEYLGLSSETVSRCFTELSKRQLIKVRAKQVQIMQPAELRRVFHG